jgi:signal transduction histidine kinase/DNA-binding response OmpR family regulator
VVLAWTILLGLAAAESAPAAVAGWQVDRWLPADGLPLDHLNRVVVDPAGYVWISTFDGLSRFDGVGFETWRRDNLPALRSNRVIALVVDADGWLVFTDELGAIYRMDPARRPLQADVLLDRGARGLVRAGPHTWAWGDHAAWQLTGGAVVERMASRPDEAHRADIAGPDLDGGLIVQARRALLRVDAAGRTREVALPPLPPSPVPRRYDVPPAVDDAGRVWAVVQDRLWRLDGAAPSPIPTEGPPCLVWRGADGEVRLSTEAGVWAGAAPRWSTPASCGEVAVADGADWVVRGGWLERDGARLTEVGDPVPGMVSDDAGGVWVASHRGLLHVRTAAVQVFGDGARRATDALVPDGRGGAWASIDRRLVHLGPAGEPLPTLPVSAISATLRASAEGARLLSRDALLSVDADGAVRSEPVPPGVEPAPGAWWADAGGRTWLAHRDGLLQRAGDGRWREVRPDGEPLLDVRDAVTLPDGGVLLLVGRQGLYAGPPDDLRRRSDLPSVDLRAAWVDGGALWLGSEDAGLCRLEGDPLTAPLACVDGAALGDHNVHHLLDDGLGRLWLGTNRGLRVVSRSALEGALAGDPGPLAVLRLGPRDGLILPEVNAGQWAAFRDAAGRLWLPTMGGPAIVEPARLPAGQPLVVQLQGLWADGQEVPVEGPVHLSPEARELRARWSVPEFVRPEQAQVRYRLEGVDRGWRAGGREATWTSLPAGAHTLVIQARLGDTWGPPTMVELSRAPSFLESRGFPVALALGAAGLTAGAAALWGRARRRRERALEEEVARRTAELVERNEALRAAAARLAVQSRQLAEVDAAKTRFVANLSHELRTPLMLVMAPLQEIIADAALGPARERARLAARNAERLRDLVEQLFDVVRLDAGRMPMRARRTELSGFLVELVQRFSPLAQARGMTLSLTGATGSAWLWVDPDLLDKTLSNLLSNALKFARCEISVTLEAGESSVRVAVADDGPGVPPEVADAIFDRFFQADASDTRSADGAGIGLALARELAELHGGGLVLTPSPQGATFELTLPRGATHLDVTDIALDPAPAEIFAPAEPAEPAGRRRVLVVEDHPELRAWLVSRLAAEFAVEAVADGFAALERLRQGGIDLLLSDIMMPGMDGLALCRAARADPALRALPVLLLSAKGPSAEPEARAAGADAFIPKPVVGHELMAALRQHLPVDPAPADVGQLARIEAVARAHLGDPELSVERLAQKVAMSPRTLQRTLNRLTGRSPVAWLQELRLEAGRDALRRGASVQEAAAAVGLSASYFTRLYGSWFGYPPSQERR